MLIYIFYQLYISTIEIRKFEKKSICNSLQVTLKKMLFGI